MAIDKLQEKIRKMKCPIVVDFGVLPEHIPPYLLDACGSFSAAYKRFCVELLEGLKESVPAVRFDMGFFSLLGIEGLQLLQQVLSFAKECGYYVILDGISPLSHNDSNWAAQVLFDKDSVFQFDGCVIQAYIGSDALRPFVDRIQESGKDLFAVVRTGNRSASEIQDLLTGSRLVHMAAADIVNRFTDSNVGKCGYSHVAFVVAASSADSLRTLRNKYKQTFFLLDGADYPNANAKNCSLAFDKLGHGAIACVGTTVTGAWMDTESPNEYVEQALQSVLKMKKNISRYISVL